MGTFVTLAEVLEGRGSKLDEDEVWCLLLATTEALLAVSKKGYRSSVPISLQVTPVWLQRAFFLRQHSMSRVCTVLPFQARATCAACWAQARCFCQATGVWPSRAVPGTRTWPPSQLLRSSRGRLPPPGLQQKRWEHQLCQDVGNWFQIRGLGQIHITCFQYPWIALWLKIG